MKLKLFSTKNETGDYYTAKYSICGKEKIEKLGYFTSENAAKRFVVEWIEDTINNLNEKELNSNVGDAYKNLYLDLVQKK